MLMLDCPSILANTTSLKSRPVFLAVAGGVESSALAFGPVISGAIAHTSSWRISFYAIIPFAVLCILIVLVSVGHIRRPENAHLSARQGLQRIDWLGFGISVPMTICLVMGLEWAGATYAWNDWRIILLLTLAGLLLVCFLSIEVRGKQKSLVPLNMLGQRSVAFASIVTFCNYAHLSLGAYYVRLAFSTVLQTADRLPASILLSSSAWCFDRRVGRDVSSHGRGIGVGRTHQRPSDTPSRLLQSSIDRR